MTVILNLYERTLDAGLAYAATTLYAMRNRSEKWRLHYEAFIEALQTAGITINNPKRISDVVNAIVRSGKDRDISMINTVFTLYKYILLEKKARHIAREILLSWD